MGQETTTVPIKFRRFLGINRKEAKTRINMMEATNAQNINFTNGSLESRNGSTLLSDQFMDNAGSTVVALTGLYEGILGGTRYQVGSGGDAFRSLASSTWINRTGSLTITNSNTNLTTFSTFLDNSTTEVFIMANGTDAPWKWTGAGNATALTSTPGNFLHQVVHKNKLWVSVGDVLYFSGLRNGESWDTANDLIRFDHRGENITGLAVYGDNIVVFQDTAIYLVSGSSNRDLFVQVVTKQEGCLSGFSIQEVESKRYGRILVYMSNEGILKGFNGTKNTIPLGDPAEDVFGSYNASRFQFSPSLNYKERKQYWCGFSSSSNSTNDRVIVYDYYNDRFTDPEDGVALSSLHEHVGINANAMAVFTSNSREVPVTGDYSGYAHQQDSGLLDGGTTAISMNYTTGELDFGKAENVKLLTDCAIVTTQSTLTNLSVTCSTSRFSGVSQLSIAASGDLWDNFLWDSGVWSDPSTAYSRCRFTLQPTGSERSLAGRYFTFQFNHNTASQSVQIDEFIVGASDLGYQSEVA